MAPGMADATSAIRINPTMPYLYTVRALIYLDQGDLENGNADYEKAKSLLEEITAKNKSSD